MGAALDNLTLIVRRFAQLQSVRMRGAVPSAGRRNHCPTGYEFGWGTICASRLCAMGCGAQITILADQNRMHLHCFVERRPKKNHPPSCTIFSAHPREPVRYSSKRKNKTWTPPVALGKTRDGISFTHVAVVVNGFQLRVDYVLGLENNFRRDALL